MPDCASKISACRPAWTLGCGADLIFCNHRTRDVARRCTSRTTAALTDIGTRYKDAVHSKMDGVVDRSIYRSKTHNRHRQAKQKQPKPVTQKLRKTKRATACKDLHTSTSCLISFAMGQPTQSKAQTTAGPTRRRILPMTVRHPYSARPSLRQKSATCHPATMVTMASESKSPGADQQSHHQKQRRQPVSFCRPVV